MGTKDRGSRRALVPEKLEERFDTGGRSLAESSHLVIAGGPDEYGKKADDEREATMAIPDRAVRQPRAEWYREAINNDPAKRARLEQGVLRADHEAGVPDNLDQIEGMLTSDR